MLAEIALLFSRAALSDQKIPWNWIKKQRLEFPVDATFQQGWKNKNSKGGKIKKQRWENKKKASVRI